MEAEAIVCGRDDTRHGAAAVIRIRQAKSASRQDMEYLCAGEDHASTVVIVVLLYQRLRCQK